MPFCDKCHTDKEGNEFDEGRAICRRCRLNALTNDLNRRAKLAARTLGNPPESVKVLIPEDVTLLFSHYPACLKCGATENLQYDHANPLALGGENENENAQTLCESCNKGKGDTFMDYRNGDICPSAPRVPKEKDHFPADSPTEWDSVRVEYITGNASFRELAKQRGVKLKTLTYHALAEDWYAERIEYRNNLRAELVQRLKAKQIDAQELALDVAQNIIASYTMGYSDPPSATDAVNAAKLMLLVQGQATERTETRDIGDWREIAASEGLNPAQIAEFEKAIKAKGEDAGGLSARGLGLGGADDRGFVA